MKSLGQKPTVAELNDMINEVALLVLMLMLMLIMVLMLMLHRWTVMATVRLTLRSSSL